MLGLTASPAERLAKLLLSWSQDSDGKDVQLQLRLTHEEIAEMIGTPRETVTRLFSEFKKKQFVQLNDATLVIRNKQGIEKLINS